MRVIVINSSVRLCVCLSVCLSVNISLEPMDRSSRNFVRTSPVAVARSSSGDVVICYVLPVLWMTSRLAVMGRMPIAGRSLMSMTTLFYESCASVNVSGASVAFFVTQHVTNEKLSYHRDSARCDDDNFKHLRSLKIVVPIDAAYMTSY